MPRIQLKIFFQLLLLMLVTPFTYAEFQGMVVSENKLASQVGFNVLKQGGNAIDAAVAVGYALAVVNPCCGNLGGGGFMTIYFHDGQSAFLNFREVAPENASADMYLTINDTVDHAKSTLGYLSVAVPGTVLGLDTALRKYGKLPNDVVMKDAIALADRGFRVTPYMAKQFAQYKQVFAQQKNVAAIFMPNGKLLQAGDTLIQKNLAATLRLIASQGTQVFYHGEIAKKIVAASQTHHGILTLNDFANYRVNVTQPLRCTYRDYELLTAPPPSSGGISLCETLNILENFSPYDHSAKSTQQVLLALETSFADRNNTLGDPRFVKMPLDKLLSKTYARQIADHILALPYHLKDYRHIINKQSLSDTTHYSVLDKFGNAVSVTYTLNGFFGAGVIASDTGFFLNDEMDDFTAKPGVENKFGLRQSSANAIAPYKQPLSSMAPTIVLHHSRLNYILGSPGGPRIITTLLLTLLNLFDAKMTLQDAINAPRFHYQGQPDWVFSEPFALTNGPRFYTSLHGFEHQTEGTWGAVEAIQINHDLHKIIGVNDARRPDGSVTF